VKRKIDLLTDDNQIPEPFLEILEGLSDREKLFVPVYCRWLCKKRAAEASGSPEKNAAKAGFEMYHRPHVKTAIQKYLAAIALTPAENVELIKKAAEGNIADYFTYETYTETRPVKVPYGEVIAQIRLEIEIEDEYLLISEDLKPIEKAESLAKIKSLQRRIRRYQAQLNKNPKAFEIQHREVERKKKVLNIEKLVEDRVTLKSVKYKPHGVEVELYSAETAR